MGQARRIGLVLLAAACASCSAPRFHAHPELATRLESIRTAGLIAPLVTVYAEQVSAPHGVPIQELIADEEATRAANAVVRDAFVAAGKEHRSPIVALAPLAPADQVELDDLADLYAVVDYSIARHVDGEMEEEIPAKQRRFDYSLGSNAEWMERQGVDAAWLVTGFILVPTTGAQVRDVVETLFAILGAAGGGPGTTTVLPKFELRAALVDRDGTVLFVARIGDGDVASGHGDAPRTQRISAACADAVFEDLRKAADR